MATNAAEIIKKLTSKKNGIQTAIKDLTSRTFNLEYTNKKLERRLESLYEKLAEINIKSKIQSIPPSIIKMLEKRDRTINKFKIDAANAEKEIQVLGGKLDNLTAIKNEALTAFLAKQDEVRRAFESNSAATSLSVELAHLDGVRQGLRDKYDRAIEEEQTKVIPYKEDKLFMYLLGKGFGSSSYRGGIWSSKIDAWVARLISFKKKKADYDHLHKLPIWISERFENLNTTIDIMNKSLDDILMKTNEPLAPLEEKLNVAKKELETVVDQLDFQKSILARAASDINKAGLLKDLDYQTIVKAYAKALSKIEIAKLLVMTQVKKTSESNSIIDIISSISREKSIVQKEIDNLMPGLHELNRRFGTIQQLLSNIAEKRWDHSSSNFNITSIDKKIDQAIDGKITVSALIWELDASQIHKISNSSSYGSSKNDDSVWGSKTPSSRSSDYDSGGFGGSSSSWSSGGGFGGSDTNTGGGF